MNEEQFLNLCRQYVRQYQDYQALKRKDSMDKEIIRQKATAILLRMAFEFATAKLDEEVMGSPPTSQQLIEMYRVIFSEEEDGFVDNFDD